MNITSLHRKENLMRAFFVLLAFVVLCTFHLLPAEAQEIPSENSCRETDSHYYRNVYPIYEYRNRRIVLKKDVETRADVQEVEINLALPRVRLTWVPQCRYLFGNLDGHYVIWDLTTNTRILELPNASRLGSFFSPDGEYLVQRIAFVGTFLWHIPTGRNVMLTDEPCGFGHQARWDMERGQLLGIHTLAINPAHCSYDVTHYEVEAYDLQTGQLVGSYDTLPDNYGVDFFLIDEGRKIVVVPQRGHVRPTITIWDRDTNTGVRILVNWPYHDGLRFSSDYRFITLYGAGRLAVWNIENPEAEPVGREPLYRIEIPLNANAEFVEPTVLEIVSRNETQRFDVTNGAYLE
jgi:WD40 repeat protein